jgi:putative transposase
LLVRKINDKQSRWTNDLNHKLSRELVNYALQQNVNVLRLEKLKGQKLSGKKYRKYNWAFADLLSKISYKAQCDGIKVISVNPAYTSQTCSQCGWKSKDNRKSQSQFICDECGLKMNADVNAAKNICGPSVTNGQNVSTGKSKKIDLAIDQALNSEVTVL